MKPKARLLGTMGLLKKARELMSEMADEDKASGFDGMDKFRLLIVVVDAMHDYLDALFNELYPGGGPDSTPLSALPVHLLPMDPLDDLPDEATQKRIRESLMFESPFHNMSFIGTPKSSPDSFFEEVKRVAGEQSAAGEGVAGAADESTSSGEGKKP